MNKFFLILFMGSLYGMDHDENKESSGPNKQMIQQVENVTCAVCKDEKEKKNLWKLPTCDHAFCVSCMVKLVKHKQTACSLCRIHWVPEDVKGELRMSPDDDVREELRVTDLEREIKRADRLYAIAMGSCCIIIFVLLATISLSPKCL